MANGAPNLKLVVSVLTGPDSGKELVATGAELTLGRASYASFGLNDQLLSRVHGKFSFHSSGDVGSSSQAGANAQVAYSDSSRNGTYFLVGGSRDKTITLHNSSHVVKPGDKLMMGDTTLRVDHLELQHVAAPPPAPAPPAAINESEIATQLAEALNMACTTVTMPRSASKDTRAPSSAMKSIEQVELTSPTAPPPSASPTKTPTLFSAPLPLSPLLATAAQEAAGADDQEQAVIHQLLTTVLSARTDEGDEEVSVATTGLLPITRSVVARCRVRRHKPTTTVS